MSILVIATFLIAALSATYAFAAETAGSSVNVTAVVMFLVFVGATLGITYWAARKTKTAADFYSAGGGLTGFQNGLAIAGGSITTDLILADPALNERAYLLMKEVQAAAVARGHGFEDSHIKRQFVVTVGMGPYRPSSLIDFVEGRDVEVEGIWGEPLRRGLAAGVAMPETQRLVDDIKARLAARA